MKKNRTILIVAFVMTVAAVWLYIRNRQGTIREELRDFAVKDTGAVTKIFLADKKGSQVLLEKVSPGQWKLNGKFIARNDAVNTLLYTMKNLEVKSPVSKTEYNTVIRLMSSGAVKTEVYMHGELAKTYYVGHPTMDQLGTFMMLEGSSAPFVMQLPGLNGYLSTRYFTGEEDWRDRTVFSYGPGAIASVSVKHFFLPEKSFTLSQSRDGNFSLQGTQPSEKQIMPDSGKAAAYFSWFSRVQCESIVKDPVAVAKDSVIAAGAAYAMSVTDTSGKTNAITIFLKPANAPNTMAADTFEGKPVRHDVDRMFALVNDNKDFVVIQEYVFGKLLRGYQDFATHHPKETP